MSLSVQQNPNKTYKFQKVTMKTKTLILSIIFSLVTAGSVWAYQGNFFSKSRFADKIVQRLTNDLELNSKQKKVLLKIKNQLIEKHNKFRKSRQTHHKALAAQIRSNRFDVKALQRQKFVPREQKRKEMRNFMLTKVAQFHKVLTKKQRAKLATIVEEFPMNRKGFRSHRRGGMDCGQRGKHRGQGGRHHGQGGMHRGQGGMGMYGQ
ncbi:MAG: putative membrane protein [bacterium]